MPRTLLDKHWTKLKPILLDLGFYDKSNLKLTLEGILFRLKTGCQWRDIPEYFGKSNTLYRNFRYWVKTGKILFYYVEMPTLCRPFIKYNKLKFIINLVYS
ncbi:transposase [Ursidibacter arcticus]|uniref:transposase n=1 Tax=Ursidibacter arcticus TaxID=1524965 RepID=UPI0012F9309D